jgi:hypothetical protein
MNFQGFNRKLHIYSGLSFFLFILLFATSGFMLNHRWEVWEYWSQRQETSRPIEVQILMTRAVKATDSSFS